MLERLSHLERERILGERFLRRQELLKQDALLRSMPQQGLSDDLDQFLGLDSLTKRQFSQLKPDVESPPSRPVRDLDSPRKVKKPRRKGEEDDSAKPLNPTEDLAKLNSICLKRALLFKLHDHLYFAEAVRDCLVKVNTGSLNGRGSYRVGLIKAVTERPGASYAAEGKTYAKFLEVAFDARTMGSVSLASVSNREIDEPEAYKLLEELRDAVGFELSALWAARKTEELARFTNYRFTGEDIMKINERNLNKAKAAGAGGSSAARKKLLEEKLNFLESRNFEQFDQPRYEEIRRLRAEVEELTRLAGTAEPGQQARYEKFLEYKAVSSAGPARGARALPAQAGQPGQHVDRAERAAVG